MKCDNCLLAIIDEIYIQFIYMITWSLKAYP